MSSGRIQWIDNARGLCMLCVIAHHTGLADMWITKAYTPVFLTLFFFISGYLYVKPDKDVNILQKFLNILTSLLLPYCIYCTATSLVHLFTGGYADFLNDVRISVLGIKSWFISALVVTQLLALGIISFKRYKMLIYTVLIISSLAIYMFLPHHNFVWNIRNALFANVYFITGILCRHVDVMPYILKNKVGAVTVFVYVCLVITDCIYNINYGNFNDTFSNYPFFILESLVGIPAFIWLCSKINRYNALFLFIGSNSLLYYYFQSSFLRGLTSLLHVYDWSIPHFVSLLIVLFIVSTVLIIPIVLVNRYFPIMSGKYRIKAHAAS